MPQDERLIEAVWEELKAVRGRGIGRLNEPKRPNIKELSLPWLEEAAKTAPGYHPNLTRMARINLLLKHEVARIEALAIREQLILSFGLRNDLDNTDTKRLRILAATLAGESETNYSRAPGTETSNLWTLAVQIVADCLSDDPNHRAIGDTDRHVAADSSAAVRQIEEKLHAPVARSKPGILVPRTWQERMREWPNPYVQRQNYQEKVKRLLVTGRRAVLLGLPGMGKTRLACEVAIDLAEEIGAEAIRLRADSDSNLLLDMAKELRDRHITVSDDDRIAREFAAMAEVAEPPLVIVLDNMTHQGILDRFPRYFQAPVIVTTRSRLLEGSGWPVVEIEEMTGPEAVRLARAQLPLDVTDDDVTLLVDALAGYPLAIVHAASFLTNNRSMTVPDFCHALEQDAGRALDRRAVNEQRLTFIYRSLLGHLEQTHRQAADLLKIMALFKQSQVPGNLLLRIFGGLARYGPGRVPDDYSQIEFANAIEMLRSYVLISVSLDDLGIHQLVQALIRSLTRDSSDSHIEATANSLVLWPGRTHEGSAIIPWLPTVFALVDMMKGRSLSGDMVMSLGKLLGVAMKAAVATKDLLIVTEVRKSWFYLWTTGESGLHSDAISYVQYDWLSFSDCEYDRLALTQLAKRNPASGRPDFPRKQAIASTHDWTAALERTLRIPLPNGSLRLVESNDYDQDIVRLMLSGNLYEARARAQSRASNSGRDVNMHLLVVAISLRQRDLSLANEHLRAAREVLSGPNSERATPIQLARLSRLDGDRTHLEYMASQGISGIATAARQSYERARGQYWSEAMPFGRLETERKLDCVLAHANSERASARLRTLLGQAEPPFCGPIWHRIRLSLAKIGLIRGHVTPDDYEACWSAAEFYATSATPDRYWHVESLMTAYLTGSNLPGIPDAELSVLFEGVTREAAVIGRKDKAELVSGHRIGAVDLAPLLAE